MLICEQYPECKGANFGSGFDFDNPDGAEGDETICLEEGCTWLAAGPYAEHSALHHWVETKHRWRLRTQGERQAG